MASGSRESRAPTVLAVVSIIWYMTPFKVAAPYRSRMSVNRWRAKFSPAIWELSSSTISSGSRDRRVQASTRSSRTTPFSASLIGGMNVGSV